LQAEPALAAHLPFVSKDIDFIGGLDDVLNAGQRLGFGVKLPHRKSMIAFAGAVLFKVGEVPANIEFLCAIPGVRPVEVSRWAVFSERGGKPSVCWTRFPSSPVN